MWPFNRQKESHDTGEADSVTSEAQGDTDQESIRCATANVVEESLYGEGGKETRRGTKHFRGGAKVYIIVAFPGMCEGATVIGHHRASGRYIKLTMKAKYLERFCMTSVYGPKVIEMIRKHYSEKGQAFSYFEHQAQNLCDSVSLWAELERNRKRREQAGGDQPATRGGVYA